MNQIVQRSSLLPTDHEMAVIETMAKQASESKLYRDVGAEAQIAMKMLAARELNIPPLQAMNGGIHMIQGKIEISARMMNAMIRKAGHSIQVKELNDDHCILIGTRKDNGDTLECKFTFEEAKNAGLVKAGGNWVKYRQDMLFARALSRLARQLFADIIGIGYVEGEIVDAECEVIPTVQKVQKVQNEDNSAEFWQLVEQFDKEAVEKYLTGIEQIFSQPREVVISEMMKDKDKMIKTITKWIEKNAVKKGKEQESNQ